VSISTITGLQTPSRVCAFFGFILLATGTPERVSAQTSSPQNPTVLQPVVVTPAKPRSSATRGNDTPGRPRRANRNVRPTQSTPAPRQQPATSAATAPTPLNGNVVAASATRLGLTVHDTPASVDIVTQQQMQEQGYRTTTEAAKGAVGVLAADVGGAPATFEMRGFTFGAVNVLYNGIWIGPSNITSRVMETANLDQIEFLKGPSSIMTGLDATGGSVNLVSRQPTTGAIHSELDGSIDSLGTYRTHFGSGGSTTIPGLDYRFDVSSSKINSFIDGDYENLNNVSGQLNYRVNDSFKVFAAIDYKNDGGHAYWGTPMTTTAFSGPFATHGVVAGSANNTFFAPDNFLSGVTIDSRTTKTNYNVSDNSVGAHELWVRGGWEWSYGDAVTVKNQFYDYGAKRHWFDSETYAFNPSTSLVDTDRFFVSHKQQVVGDNTDLTWNSAFLGMENRFAGQLQVSSNSIQFAQEENPDDYPYAGGSVSVVNPMPGPYALTPMPGIRNSRLDDAAISVEDQLKITPMLALIGGIRAEDLSLTRDGTDPSDLPGGPANIPTGLPFSKNWQPVSYRAAATFEPVKGLMFYGMYATAYDPAVADIFSVTPGTSLDLTSSRIYETGAKVISDDKRAEATIAVYDIQRRNVYVALTDEISTLAGEVHSQGVELAGAVRPIEPLKLWGNVAFNQTRFGDFGDATGNIFPNVAPVIINAGASYRFDNWRWPVEIGGSLRHVGERFVASDNLTTMLPYTTADLYAFVDIPGRDLSWQGLEKMRVGFRVRNLTNALYAEYADPGLPDSVLLGAPRTFELSASAKW
jgi:iron complex outermembrane receptor protein